MMSRASAGWSEPPCGKSGEVARPKQSHGSRKKLSYVSTLLSACGEHQVQRSVGMGTGNQHRTVEHLRPATGEPPPPPWVHMQGVAVLYGPCPVLLPSHQGLVSPTNEASRYCHDPIYRRED